MIYDKMNDCFDSLYANILYGINYTDLPAFFKKLDEIEGATIVTGVGGSSVVARFLAKVLREKKHIIATAITPRDLEYMDLGEYRNVIACSYSGNNIGVDASFDNDLNRYLLTGHAKDGVENILYEMRKEESYVSVSATMVPLSLLFLYYTDRNTNLLKEIIDDNIRTTSKKDIYEVIYGYESETAATMLESCLTESGMGACVLHDKYNFCHGRINLSRKKLSTAIFFRSDNELDDTIANHLDEIYGEAITIGSRYEDAVINDFHHTLLSLKLIHSLAETYDIDISDMKELPINDIFYLFKGKMK